MGAVIVIVQVSVQQNQVKMCTVQREEIEIFKKKKKFKNIKEQKIQNKTI